MEDRDSVTEALEFLISNRVKPMKDVDKKVLLDYTDILSQESENGLPLKIIKPLAESIVFSDHYSVNIRRRLLYSLIPQSREFPYSIIPIAVSYSNYIGASPMLQYSTLSWISGLLEYNIVNHSDMYIHVCYPALFNMINHEKLITKREDVTFHRVQVLLGLQRKLGFQPPISNLLRTYQMYRPDLVVAHKRYGMRNPSLAKSFQARLAAARERLEADMAEDGFTGDDMWPELERIKKNMNPFGLGNVIPQPFVLVYADKIEEKKERKISVLQYCRIKDMIRHISKWRDWLWPNSPACLLWKPAALPLFLPHRFDLKVAISNWLEIALRTEIIGQIGNQNRNRQRNLLSACIQFVKHNDAHIPIIHHFLVEFLISWDQYSHFSQILELLSNMPYSSPIEFFESILEKFCQVLGTSSLATWCAIVNAFSNMAVTWALEAQNTQANEWPLRIHSLSPLEGIFFLTKRLERTFFATILRLGPHPLIINSILSYYNKVNFICETLNLPLIVTFPPEFLFVVVTSLDLTAINQVGVMLCSLKSGFNKLQAMKPEGYDRLMKSVSLHQIEGINLSMIVFLDSIVTCQAFSDKWLEVLSHYFEPPFLKTALSLNNIEYFGSCCRSMVFSNLTAEYFRYKGFQKKDSQERQNLVNMVMKHLYNRHMDGIRLCALTFIQ